MADQERLISITDYLDPLRRESYSRPEAGASLLAQVPSIKRQEVILNEKYSQGSSHRGFHRGC